MRVATGSHADMALDPLPVPGGVLALFGPTSSGKTGVAVEMARILRDRGEEPVAVNCDSMQIYEGIGVLSGAAGETERSELEHRLIGFVPQDEEMSAGVFAELAHAEIDRLIDEGRIPLVVGGTGLWLKAALCDLELRPPVERGIRLTVESEIESRGSVALHAELPQRLAARVHPNDRKRVARWTELLRSGVEPESDSSGMWEAALRHPTRLIGLSDTKEELARRIDQRVDAMAAEARIEARRLIDGDSSRTVRAAIGVEGFLSGDLEAVKAEHLAYAKRQLTWMRKMPQVELIERAGRTDRELARLILVES